MKNIILDEVRRDRSALLDALQQAGADVSRPSKIKCPFHDDKHASAGVYESQNGVWRFKCHSCGAGGDVFDVRAKAQGRNLSDVLRDELEATVPNRHTSTCQAPPPAQPLAVPAPTSERAKRIFESIEAIKAAMPDIVAEYLYTHPSTGRVEMVVFRREPGGGGKSFIQARPEGDGFVLEAPPKPWPLYNRKRVLEAERVVVVEGEKCVHALHNVGVVATTSPGGAGKAQYADWSLLAGKTVVLWPDNDPPDNHGVRKGIAHMRDVAKVLERLDPAPRLLWIDPDTLGLPPKGDAADLLAQVGNEDTNGCRLVIENVLLDAVPMGASAEVSALIEDTISGKRRAIEWPWPVLSQYAKALYPGTVTVLCGDPGASKSFLLLEALAHWHDQGLKVAVFELEESRQYHLYRVLAQRVGSADLFNDTWVAAHPEQAREYYQKHAGFLDSFGRVVYSVPDKQVSLSELAAWVEARAMDGCRIIAIDPITAAQANERPWVEDLAFLIKVKQTIQQFDCSLILVTHPKKGRKSTSFGEMAGGAAFERFSQNILWLESLYPPIEVNVRTPLGPTTEKINRSIAIRKTRNGEGGGMKVACQFDRKTLRLVERGVVTQ